MKKLALVAAIALSALATQSFKNENKAVDAKAVNDDCQYGQCSYIKRNNEQCKNCAQKDSYYCYTHRQ
jgi:hypothetical protein